MDVSLAVLADFASITKEGKLNILGIFDIVYTNTLPARHPKIHLILKLDANIEETKMDKKITIKLMDPDGKTLMEVGGDFTIGEVKPGELFTVNSILTLQNINFEQEGHHDFHILIGEELKRTVPLKVKLKKEDS